MPHRAIRLKYLLYKLFIPLRLPSLTHSAQSSLSISLPLSHSFAHLSFYLFLAHRTSEHRPLFLFHPDFPAAARIFSSFLPPTPLTLHLYILPFSSTLIFLRRPLRRSHPAIRQRIKAACVRRYLRPMTPTRLLISSRGSKNTPLRPCVLSRARRGHRGYPSDGVATWVIRGWPAETNREYSRWTKYPGW